LRKGEPTRYPVPYTLWTRRKGVGRIPTHLHWEDAHALLKCQRLIARPIGSATGSWQTGPRRQRTLRLVEGENPYKARLGARVEPYGVFLLEVKQVLSDGNLIVRNLVEKGKRRVPEVAHETVEPDLVFPAVRGADIRQWAPSPQVYVLLTQDPQKSEPYPESHMKSHWPRTYGYLTRFRSVLLSRGSKPVRELAQRTAFYAMFGIGPYTVARYKVIWKRMASDLIAAVVSQFKTPFGYKTIVPTDTTSLIAAGSEDEAHYLCAVLNSNAVREFVRSYSSAGRGFGAPSVIDHIAVPRFAPGNRVHQELARLSRVLHELGKQGKGKQVAALEQRVDAAASTLFRLRRG